MKTIKTLFATGLMALVLTSASVYANGPEAQQQAKATAIHVSAIKKLVIKGNVEVTVSQQPKAKALFTNEGLGDVVVKKVGNTLFIDSKNSAQASKITVYVDDIYRIDASGEAVVNTGLLNLKYLQVFLAGNATLDLNAQTESLYTVMKNTSALTLKGSTDSHIINMEKLARVTLDGFTAKKTDMTSTDVYVAARR